MKLSKSDTQVLKGIMTEQGWDVLMRLLGQKITELNDLEITGNNEFETLRALHKRDGGKEELKNFFDYIERGTFTE